MQVNDSFAQETFNIRKLWNEQHPIIHAWFLLSSISICFLSAILFIIP